MRFKNWLIEEQIIEEVVMFYTIMETLMATIPNANELQTALEDAQRDPGKIGKFLELIKPTVEKHVHVQLRGLSIIKSDIFDDVVQEVLMKIWKNITKGFGTAIDPERFMQWLAGVVHNQIIDLKRKRKPTLSIDSLFGRQSEEDEFDPSSKEMSPEISPSQAAETSEETSEDLAMIRSEILTLDPRSRIVLGLHYGEGLKVVEIAQALEIPVGTVKTRLRTARNKLSKSVQRILSKRARHLASA